MLSWLSSLFTKKEVKVRKKPDSYRSRARLTRNEVLAISKDILLKKKRKDIIAVYNISIATYHKIKHGQHKHQRGV